MDNVLIQRLKRWLPEAIPLIIVFSIAIYFRLWMLDKVPGGMHYDEAIDLRQGLRILGGDFFLFTREGWGREALFYYLVAASLAAISDNFLAIRATVAICSIGVAITSYLLARRFTDRQTALMTVAWFAVLYWSVFASRFGVRGITLPLLLGLCALAFWRAWSFSDDSSKLQTGLWIVFGILLGLTIYTYQPARFVPLLFLLFGAYLWLIHRQELREKWRGLLIGAVTAIIVTLPLIVTLLANPGLESGREWTIAPLTELLEGHPALIVDNIVATAKMFTISGDPLIADNIPFRPLFVPAWTGIFFFGGLLIGLWRWRQPQFIFVLLWLLISILPTIVTTSAPNYNRIIAAIFPITFLAALPVRQASRFIHERTRNWTANLPLVLAIIALAATAYATWNDYFHNWPETRIEDFNVQFNVSIEEMANRLEDEVDSQTVLINSRNLEDSHPYILSAIVGNRSSQVRWVDTAQALVRPKGVDRSHLYLAGQRWIDSKLANFLDLSGKPIEVYDHFEVYEIDYEDWPESTSDPVSAVREGQSTFFSESRSVVYPPISFGEEVRLMGIYDLDYVAETESQFSFYSRWDVEDGTPLSLAIFVHLLDMDGELVSQQDGLGYPPHSWKEGDSFVQVHSIDIPQELPAGRYFILLGLYDRASGVRWPIMVDGEQAGDRLLIGSLSVE